MAASKNRKFEADIARISPATARKILDANKRNRSLRMDYVRHLAGAMERREWMVNGEPVQIAEDGTLLNGQHRLAAVVESGATVSMLVVRGLPIETQKTMDVGTRRTLSDVLALHNEADTTNLATILGLLHRYRLNVRLDHSARTAPTVAQALELLEREPSIKEVLPEARRVNKETHMRVSVAALLLYVFEEADPGAGDAFFSALCDPQGEQRGSAVLRLHSHLSRVREKRKLRFSTPVLSAMTIKAFNAWREGRPVGNLFYRPGGKTPEQFPVILSRSEIEGK